MLFLIIIFILMCFDIRRINAIIKRLFNDLMCDHEYDKVLMIINKVPRLKVLIILITNVKELTK